MSKKQLVMAAFETSIICTANLAGAQSHSDGMTHSAGTTAESADVAVSEPGQSAFAAIAEIVTQLESNPNTD